MATIKVEGLRELDQALAAVAKDATAKAMMRRALKEAAQPMADMAQSLAPVGETHGLQKSVRVGTLLSRRQARLHRKMVRDDRAAVEMFVGPGPDPAAIAMEFGTEPHTLGGQYAGAWHPGTEPQPFMRPAWDAEAVPTVRRLANTLAGVIARAAKRAARIRAKG